MKRIIRLCIVGLLLVVLASCSLFRPVQKEPLAQTKDVAQQIGEALVSEDGDVSAVSIAIMHEGDIVYSQGFGLRDVENNLPVDSHTRFNIGSISKIFTGASILLLEDEGLLKLDDKVVDLLPNFTMADERHKDITVRMLLNHTSGMPGTNMRNAFSDEPSSVYLQQSMQEFANSNLKHDAGAFSPYCNDGFTIAQVLVEHLSGIPFPQFLQERIFNPLGMNDSSVGFQPQEENMAYGYIERAIQLPVEYANITASGGLTSTALDLCRFVAIAMEPTLLREETITEYLGAQPPTYLLQSGYPPLLSYGLGWDFVSWEPYQSQGIQVLGKTGGTLEYSTMIFFLPQSQSAVVLLSSGHLDPIGTTLPIVDALLKETGQIPEKTKTEKAKALKTQPLPPDIETYSGYYYGGKGLLRLSFAPHTSSLRFETYDGSTFVETDTSRYIGDGIFENQSGTWNTFETLNTVPCLMEIRRPYNVAGIAMTKLSTQPSIEHSFTPSSYVPVNLPANDLYFPVFTVSFIEELPSHLIVDNAIYAITGQTETSMVLPALRDQAAPRLDENGHLIIGSYICMNTSDIRALEKGEAITIDGDEKAVLREITEQGTFTCTVPEGGRIVVLGPDLSDLEDTLYSGSDQLEMDIFGSYVVFMADRPMVFQPSIT